MPFSFLSLYRFQFSSQSKVVGDIIYLCQGAMDICYLCVPVRSFVVDIDHFFSFRFGFVDGFFYGGTSIFSFSVTQVGCANTEY
mmetsp:Transcript_15063/g.22167  ORF Transcript_15063/g.22167 Transcript_15063/m.22167 type:complete len:84 (-) Transcript_15063:81-332(-)